MLMFLIMCPKLFKFKIISKLPALHIDPLKRYNGDWTSLDSQKIDIFFI